MLNNLKVTQKAGKCPFLSKSVGLDLFQAASLVSESSLQPGLSETNPKSSLLLTLGGWVWWFE